MASKVFRPSNESSSRNSNATVTSSSALVRSSPDVAALFRTRRVTELRAIEAQARADADDKATELRSLLGSRYRDLLDVAEKTRAMDGAAAGARAAVTEARELTRAAAESMRRREDTEREMTESASRGKNLEKAKAASELASKLRTIVDAPEVIYSSLDACRVESAAQRYILALSAKKDLDNDPSAKPGSAFIELQWRSVSSLLPQIITAAKFQLHNPTNEKDEHSEISRPAASYTAAAAATLISLNAQEPLAVLESYLRGRKREISSCFTGPSPTSSGEKFERAATLLRSAYLDAVTVFGGHLAPEKSEPANRPGIISLSKQLKRLQSAETTFQDEAKLSVTAILQALTEWTTTVKEEVARSSSVALESLLKVKDINTVFDQVVDVFISSEDLELISRWFHVQSEASSGLYSVFTESLAERARRLTASSFRSAMIPIVGRVNILKRAERPIVFDDSESMLLPSLDQMIFSSDFRPMNDVDGAELIHMSLFSSVLSEIDGSLKDVLADVQSIAEKLPEVSPELRSASENCMKSILESLAKMGDDESDIPGLHRTRVYVLVSVLLITLASSKGLQNAFEFGLDTAQASKCPAYTQFVEDCTHLASSTFAKWAASLTRHESEAFGSELMKMIEFSAAIMTSSISCPASASPPLVKFLVSCCSQVSAVGGFALPPYGIAAVLREIERSFLEIYETTVKMQLSSLNKVPGQIAVQLLFDLYFVKHILYPIGSKGSDVPIRRVISSLESFLDPIDWASVERLVQESSQVYIQKSGMLLGVLLPATLLENETIMCSADRYASLLPVGAVAPRLTFLPAPTPVVHRDSSSNRFGKSGSLKRSQVGGTYEGTSEGADQSRMATSSIQSDGVVENLTHRFSSIFNFGGKK